MLRSRNSSSGSRYQPLESSEYELLEHEGLDVDGSWPDPNSHPSFPDNYNHDSRRGSRPSAYDDDPIRTVSRQNSAALSHPTPDSQSFTRANITNIERLEESAERLSLNSNIGEELRKLQDRQKHAESRKSSVRARQISATSQSNSIVNVNSVARSGGFSPEAYVASPSGSIQTPWSVQSGKSPGSGQIMDHASKTSEPVKEGRPLDFPPSPESKVLTVRNSTDQDLYHLQEKEDSHHLKEPSQIQNLDRPNSAASGDTFRRAHDAFADFDGVHIHSDTPEIEDESHGLLEPEAALIAPEGEEPVTTYVPPDHENLVYYPAPVPMMLNLPAKLSKGPSTAEMAKRRSGILRDTDQMGQSVVDLTGSQEHVAEGVEGSTRKRASKLPPQLRASLFFDQTPVDVGLEMTGGSAVQTLDNLLDASAHAPVTAFTDHPMAGREGAEIYAGEKESKPTRPAPAKRESTQKPKAKRRGSSFFAFGAKLRGVSKPVEEEEAVEANEGEEDDGEQEAAEHEEEEESQVPVQRPSTLLAELQIRKAQQKQRNRTAATAFPDGMHSTLLQLDAVAQYQKQARKKKQISLAWEDPEDDGNEDPDEDVPLGVLFPGSQQQQEDSAARYPEDRPLGLLAQRKLEESEPLSQRRARLHGTHGNARGAGQNARSTARFETTMAPDASQAEEEEETLGQRRRRLRGDQPPAQQRPLSSDFASEILSQFGVNPEQETGQPPSKTPDPEETLGQRRKRLQAEKQARQASAQSASTIPSPGATLVKSRSSMADLLQSNPIGSRQVSNTVIPGTSPSGLVNTSQNMRHASTFQQPKIAQHPGALRRSRTDQQAFAEQYQSVQYPNPMVQYGQYHGGHPGMIGAAQQYFPAVTEQTSMHPQQRAMIDRWRQSVI